jgi:hypothetical protein
VAEEKQSDASSRGFFGAWLLAAVGAVVCSRAILLGRSVDVLTARSEKRFFGWAFRDPPLNAALARMAPRLRDGEAICLQSRLARHDPWWLRVMGTYAFSRQVVVVPGEASKASTPPCKRTTVVIRPDGLLVLLSAPGVALR